MLKYFSPYSFLPDKLHPIEEEREKPLKTEYGNSLAGSDCENAPVSIHQKYWIEEIRDIYPVGLGKKDWQEEIRKIIDLQPAPVTAPKIKQPKIEVDSIEPHKPTKPKGFKRAKSKKKSKSLF